MPSSARPRIKLSGPGLALAILLGCNAIAILVLALVVIDRYPQLAASPPPLPPADASGTVPATEASPPGGATMRQSPYASRYSVPPWITAWFVPLSGPLRVAIQVGHLDNRDLPKEQAHLKGNDGARVGKLEEWEINLMVAKALAERLEGEGMEIILVPARVEPGLRVDAFVAIHCDWAERPKNHGWKLSPPERSNRASLQLAQALTESFAETAGIVQDQVAIGDRMYDYYAFNWRNYQHAISPLSPAVIVELGFMSNPPEFRRLTRDPDFYAAILERGIRHFLAKSGRTDVAALVPGP